MGIKNLNVRVDERLIEEIETYRDPKRYRSVSEFTRHALKKLVREERRRRIKADLERIAQDPDELRALAAMADANIPEIVERWEKADRGEL